MPHRIATLVLLSSTALASPAHKPPPPDKEVKKELLDLRAEAFHLTNDQVKAQLKHFKPMCDAEGYPLVGNIAVKGDQANQPSAVCKLIRERPASRSW